MNGASSVDDTWDVIVLGAGAAGLMAGLRAAECGARTLVLEKNARPGVKILMSGGTRCNITHDCDNRGIVDAFGPNGKFLHSALASFGVRETIGFFEQAGVITKVEETGKIFPVSNKASDVLHALLARLNASGATLSLSEPVEKLTLETGRWRVTTSRRLLSTRTVILTTGGKSYPGSGTTGDGYRIATAFGHSIVPLRPALTPIATNAPWIASLRGITLPDVELSLTGVGNRPINRRGSLLFAHFGLSGPVALDISRFISGHSAPSSLSLSLDLLPHRDWTDIDAELRECSVSQARKLLANVIAQWIPHRLAEVILQVTHQPIDRTAAALNRVDRETIARQLKGLLVPTSGTLGFAKAEVTAGGIDLAEVQSKSMQSMKSKGLFLAGEVLDLDGPIGGYNFQAAWSTGWLAGTSAAAMAKK